MLKLSQRDPRWGWKPIGNSNSLIKDFGCTITGLSMLSDYFGTYKDPAWMSKNLRFLVDKVLWQSVTEKTCFKFVWRFYTHDSAKIQDALKDPDKACLLNVYNRHWVVGVRKMPLGYWVIDPWTGSGKYYANTSISGGAIFHR